MTRIWILLVILGVALSGCGLPGWVSSAREERAVAPDPIPAGEAITIVGLAGVTDETLACIDSKLRAALNATRVIPPKAFRESMFPWFEPHLAPADTESLEQLMRQRKVKERIDEMRLHYIVTISGATYASGGDAGITPIGIFGYGTERTHLTAGVLDMTRMRSVDQIDAAATGGAGGGFIMIAPFAYSFSSMKAACQVIAERVVAYVTGGAQIAPVRQPPRE